MPVPTINGAIYKCPNHQNTIDVKLRERFSRGMRDGTDVTIRFNIGFETYGAYEDWGQGYVVEHVEPETGDRVWASAQYLDDAIDRFLTKPYRSKPKDPEQCSRPKWGWCSVHNSEILAGARICSIKLEGK